MIEWMLWGRFGGSIRLGSAPPPRLFLIPLNPRIEGEGPLAAGLGHYNPTERTLDDVTRSLDRAVSGEFDGVIFPSALFFHPEKSEIYSRCESRQLRIVHQWTFDFFKSATESAPRLDFQLSKLESRNIHPILEEIKSRLIAGDAINIVFSGHFQPTVELLSELFSWPDQIYFTYSVRAKDRHLELLRRLHPFIKERLFFHFPYHLEFHDGFLSCKKIHSLIERIHTELPDVRVRPMLGTENFDPRVDPDLELEPVHAPVLYSKAEPKNSLPFLPKTKDVSVIIPSYNNRDYLINTIKHLIRQDLDPHAFEIVVVDDGSTDHSQEAILELLTPYLGKINFQYIYSPRNKPRKMGDANYRAGISRNLGAKNASGKIFCFLDSDILTPPEFLSDLIEKHKSYDVVQCKRLNLIKDKSNADIRFDNINVETDTFFTEGGYWEHFYSLRDWQNEPFFWKYTCTYGLSVPAKLFKRIGWIRRGFVFYGFEDVELGYRLAKVGARFYLNPIITYHLFHKNERSEFHNSDYLRQSLLAKTAQIFYLGLLDPEIFYHFRGLMKEQLPLRSLFSKPTLSISPNSNLKKHAATTTFLTTPLLALWNWRLILWKWLQQGKHHPVWSPYATRLEQLLKLIEKFIIKIFDFFSSSTMRRHISRMSSALQLWRIRIWVNRLTSHTWKARVFAKRASGSTRKILSKLQLWRIRIWIKRFNSQAWRLELLWQNCGVLLGRLYGVSIWLLGWVYGRSLELRTFVTRLILPRVYRACWAASFPIRKICYFTSYQVQHRLLTRPKSEMKHEQRDSS